ncbi:MAG: hypothetical protein HY592_01935 [Candidatus Omnitrophica bacterium]|nr:hypothetical protein [Candidatus Omnitrophota bacterium]
MLFHRSERFKKDGRKLPKEILRKLSHTLELFAKDERHPSLHIKKMEGADHIWEMRLTISYRVTFERVKDGIFLRRVGSHDILKNP